MTLNKYTCCASQALCCNTTCYMQRVRLLRGGGGGGGGCLYHFPPKFAHFFGTCHNFFPLSSVQIIIMPACCLLCVL